MKRFIALAISLVAMIGTGSSFAVSDGHYDPSRQHCAGTNDNSDNATYVNPDCKSFIFTISDYTGHEYVGAGFRQTTDGTFANTGDFWIDPGQGQKTTFSMGQDGPGGPTMTPSTVAADPTTGLRVYFGADDNLDGGEHDSSNYVNNGPSDGGSIEFNIDPSTAAAWVAALQAADAATLAENPAPVASGGFGACADGLCLSIDSHRSVAFKGGDHSKHRDAANYVWSDGSAMQWDPYNCAGPSDGAKDCSDATHPNSTIEAWVAQTGTVNVEPGIQIYEDPDPQGSPGVLGLVTFGAYPGNDPYPLPSLYVGPCGLVVGGGEGAQAPASPLTNAAGQLVIPTVCN